MVKGQLPSGARWVEVPGNGLGRRLAVDGIIVAYGICYVGKASFGPISNPCHGVVRAIVHLHLDAQRSVVISTYRHLFRKRIIAYHNIVRDGSVLGVLKGHGVFEKSRVDI